MIHDIGTFDSADIRRSVRDAMMPAEVSGLAAMLDMDREEIAGIFQAAMAEASVPFDLAYERALAAARAFKGEAA